MMKSGIKILLEKIHKRGFDVINYTIFGLFAVVTIFPLYYIYVNAFSSKEYVQRGEVFLWPKGFTLNVFIEIFNMQGIGQALMNSILRTILGIIVAVSASAVLGYVMTRTEFKHRKFWYRYFIITMYVGAGLIPGYLNMKDLGFLNSFWWVYIAGGISQSYNMILTKTYIESLPPALEEAAYIDGAGYFKRFMYIVIPLSKPILATIAVFAGVGQWNAYMDTLLYMTKGGNQTLQSVLYKYLHQAQALADVMKASGMVNEELMRNLSPLTIKYAITAITVTPILLVYPFFQRYFAKGIMIGAVKG